MKKSYIKLIAIPALAGITFLLMSNGAETVVKSYHNTSDLVVLNSAGAVSARTGAPGESTCTQCHSGATQDGNALTDLSINGGGNEFVPGSLNSMTLTMSNGSNKNGFQLVALDASEEMAGSFTIVDATNTKLISNAGLNRDYVSHTAAGTSSNSWEFEWEAPVQAENVTFYVATNKTNSNNATSGDEIYLSSFSFVNSELSIGQVEHQIEADFRVGYSPSNHTLKVDFPVSASNTQVSLNVIDLSGKSVFFDQQGAFQQGNHMQKVRLPDALENGIYGVTLFVGNQPFSSKVMVSR